MWCKPNEIGSCLLAALGFLLLGGSADATTSYGNFAGTNVTFQNVRETSTTGDPEPLFGAPTVVGDQLLFFPPFPPGFIATAAGAGGLDQTGAQLQTEILVTAPLGILDTLRIREIGDSTLVGAGTAATGAFISMSGFVTVTDTLSGPITPIVIGFIGTFSQDLFTLPADPGFTAWNGQVLVDIAAIVPDATRAVLSLNNDLVAYSEAGTSATIQKRATIGPAITVEIIPEPATAALLGFGLIGLTALARHGRS